MKQENATWEYYNPNPFKKKTTDCVIRAIAKAKNISWDNAFDLLVNKGKELKETPTSMIVVEDLFKSNKTLPVKYSKNGQKYRLKVNEITFKGTLLVRVAHHVVCYSNGKYFDIFDCGDKSLYKAWVV